MDWEQLNDEKLVEYYLIDNVNAKNEFVRRFGKLIYSVAKYNSLYDQDIDDLFNESWLCVLRYLPRYDAGNYRLRKWIALKASGACIEWLRKEGRQKGVIVSVLYDEQGEYREYIAPISLNNSIYENSDEQLDELISIDYDNVFESVKANMDMEIIKKAIDRLPMLQQTVIKLRYFMDLTYEEISEITGRSRDAIYKSVCVGSKMLTIEVFNNVVSIEKLKGMLPLVPNEYDREILRLFTENMSFNEIAKSMKEKSSYKIIGILSENLAKFIKPLF